MTAFGRNDDGVGVHALRAQVERQLERRVIVLC
jgi:hypothetical protein